MFLWRAAPPMRRFSTKVNIRTGAVCYKPHAHRLIAFCGVGSVTYSDMKTLKISGKGAGPGGVYDEVAVAGSARVGGDLEAATVSIAGSCMMEGAVKAGAFAASGAFEVGRDLHAKSLRASGTGEVGGDVRAETLKFSGRLIAGGTVKAREATISGFVECGGNLEADQLQLTGAFDVGGSVGGQRIQIALAGRSRASEIVAPEISVRRASWRWRLLDFPWRRSSALLSAETIEGEKVHLEATHAGTVRGRQVTIGPGCRIEVVEYSESLHLDPQADVAHHFSSVRAASVAPVDHSPVPPDGWSGSARPKSLSRWRVRFGRSEIHQPALKIVGVALALMLAALVIALVLFVALPAIGFMIGMAVAILLVALLAGAIGIPLLVIGALVVRILLLPIQWAVRRSQ
jgi:cytoskeletal protein CcmA (bactofilin family)